MDQLGRFYTQDIFSNLLVETFENERPNRVLELGVGDGSLLKAAHQRWKHAEFFAADIDPASVIRVAKKMPFVRLFELNSLTNNIENALLLDKSSIDIAVCNPPYLPITDKHPYRSLFEETGLQQANELRRITADLVFLAQNFKMLRTGGELGIILPDNIITGKDFVLIRQALFENHRIKAAIELPDRIFPKTDAKTHILIFEKGGETGAKVPLYIADKQGQCYDELQVVGSALVERMDYSFHKINKTKSLGRTLAEFPHTVIRGNTGNKELKLTRKNFLHSTSFRHGALLKIRFRKQDNSSLTWAVPGDILVVRVGSRCVGKCALVVTGTLPISDCLFIIRVSAPLRDRLWEFLISEMGDAWLKAYAHGVCSRVLSKSDISKLPIPPSKFTQ